MRRGLSLILGPMGLAPYQSHIFKQASQTRKQTKPPSFWTPPGPSTEGSLVIPSHTALGTQRPSDSCPSTRIRSTFLEDRNC